MIEAGVALIAVAMFMVLWARTTPGSERSAPAARLPRYRLRAGDREIAIYVENGSYVCSVAGLWDIRAGTLPKLRERAEWCLEATGWIPDGAEIELTAVRQDVQEGEPLAVPAAGRAG